MYRRTSSGVVERAKKLMEMKEQGIKIEPNQDSLNKARKSKGLMIQEEIDACQFPLIGKYRS